MKGLGGPLSLMSEEFRATEWFFSFLVEGSSKKTFDHNKNIYCMSKKKLPNLYSNLLCKKGKYFLDTHSSCYVRWNVLTIEILSFLIKASRDYLKMVGYLYF